MIQIMLGQTIYIGFTRIDGCMVRQNKNFRNVSSRSDLKVPKFEMTRL